MPTSCRVAQPFASLRRIAGDLKESPSRSPTRDTRTYTSMTLLMRSSCLASPPAEGIHIQFRFVGHPDGYRVELIEASG